MNTKPSPEVDLNSLQNAINNLPSPDKLTTAAVLFLRITQEQHEARLPTEYWQQLTQSTALVAIATALAQLPTICQCLTALTDTIANLADAVRPNEWQPSRQALAQAEYDDPHYMGRGGYVAP